jgi:hypothetical protein
MLFKQRLFTLMLGLIFSAVLSEQASALYDPGVGRFCSRDPIGYFGLDCNLTRLVFNRPLVAVDPSGHGSCEITMYMGHTNWVEGKILNHGEPKVCEKLAPICCKNKNSVLTCEKIRPGSSIDDWPVTAGYIWCEESAANDPRFDPTTDWIIESKVTAFADSILNAAKGLCKDNCDCLFISITPKCDYTPGKAMMSDCMKKLANRGVITYNWCFNRNRFNCKTGELTQPMIN